MPLDTKQFIIPTKYFLGCIAEDKEVAYPFDVCVMYRKGGSIIRVHNREELLSLCKSRDIYQSSLTYAEVRSNRQARSGEFHIEVMHNGRYTVPAKFMPDRRHGETLLKNQVQKLYQLKFHPKEAAINGEAVSITHHLDPNQKPLQAHGSEEAEPP